MTPRIASSVLVGALIRKAEADGGFAAVLNKGDAVSGAVLVILAERGGNVRIVERALGPNGLYAWHQITDAPQDPKEVPPLVERRRRFDPDLWVVELDIACAERFAADMNAIG